MSERQECRSEHRKSECEAVSPLSPITRFQSCKEMQRRCVCVTYGFRAVLSGRFPIYSFCKRSCYQKLAARRTPCARCLTRACFPTLRIVNVFAKLHKRLGYLADP